MAAIRTDGFMSHPLPPLPRAETIQCAGLLVERRQFVPRAECTRFKNARPDAFVQAGQDEVTPSLACHLRVDEQVRPAAKMIAISTARPGLLVGRFLQPFEKRAARKHSLALPQPCGRIDPQAREM